MMYEVKVYKTSLNNSCLRFSVEKNSLNTLKQQENMLDKWIACLNNRFLYMSGLTHLCPQQTKAPGNFGDI